MRAETERITVRLFKFRSALAALDLVLDNPLMPNDSTRLVETRRVTIERLVAPRTELIFLEVS
mgnify:CR=1 FL=1